MSYYGKFIGQGVNGIQVNWGSPYSFRDKMPCFSFSSYTSDLSEQFAIAASVYRNGYSTKRLYTTCYRSKWKV